MWSRLSVVYIQSALTPVLGLVVSMNEVQRVALSGGLE